MTRKRLVRCAAVAALVGVLLIGCGSVASYADGFFLILTGPIAFTVRPGDHFGDDYVYSRGNQFSGLITMVADQLPDGVTMTFSPNPTSGDSTTLSGVVDASVTPTTYHITLRATAPGAAEHDLNVTLVVAAAASYRLSAASSAVTVAAGSSATDSVSISRNAGFTDDVFMSAIVPTGITVDFSPSDVTGSTTVATIHAAAGLAAGSYLLTINGIVAGQAEQALAITVTVH